MRGSRPSLIRVKRLIAAIGLALGCGALAGGSALAQAVYPVGPYPYPYYAYPYPPPVIVAPPPRPVYVYPPPVVVGPAPVYYPAPALSVVIPLGGHHHHRH